MDSPDKQVEAKLREHLRRIDGLNVIDDDAKLDAIRAKIQVHEARRAFIARLVIIALSLLILAAVMWWIPR